jgi:hypothetical protein
VGVSGVLCLFLVPQGPAGLRRRKDLQARHPMLHSFLGVEDVREHGKVETARDTIPESVP